MDLGLKALDDDQLIELLGQCCNELAERDPVVRDLAQSAIFGEAEKLRLMKESAKEAVEEARSEYIEDLHREVGAEVRRAVQAGEIRLLSPAEESREVAIGDLETRVKLLDEEISTLEDEDDPEALFRLRYANGYLEADVRLGGFEQRRYRVELSESQMSVFAGSILQGLKRRPADGATRPIFRPGLVAPW
jgi:hypothetical protein